MLISFNNQPQHIVVNKRICVKNIIPDFAVDTYYDLKILAAPVEGGEPLLFSKDRKPLISWAKRGKGMVAVTACSTSFTNKEMGDTEDVPNKDQLFLCKMEFWMLTGLMKGHFGPFSSFSF